MANWAPLVHGRTYEVDFRPNLIVCPKGFSQPDIDWAFDVARATTRKLDKTPRWTLIKTARYLIAAVTCMADSVSEDCNRDKPLNPGDSGRPLYVFLGWVTTDLGATPPPMDLKEFRILYQYVRDRWQEKKPGDQVVESPYTSHDFAPPPPDLKPVTIKGDLDRLELFADAKGTALWYSAARQGGLISVCLGLADHRDAFAGPFTAATVAGEDTEAVMERLPHLAEAVPSTAVVDRRNEAEDVRRGARPSHESAKADYCSILMFPVDLLMWVLRRFLQIAGASSGSREPPQKDRIKPAHRAVPEKDCPKPAHPASLAGPPAGMRRTDNAAGGAFDEFEEEPK